MLNVLSVFIGGGIGASFRYLICHFIGKECSLLYPWHTLGINIAGSFLLGFLIYFINAKTGFNPQLKLFLTVGFCGGLTTFSTFSLEVFELIKEGRILESITYILLSVLICVLGAFMGACFAKFV
ncbi:MAG: fluoride efflux transporter CrcB [Candidatus Gastranaerophilales bacterium]|nr:fluoride efflux transporter CrcB [Candidatus Gastranaerophilales bacterium]